MKIDNKEKREFTVPAKNVVQQESGANIFFESGGEFVLPDYMPKVQKVLRMEAKVLPPERYMAASEAQMSGNVLHTLIYVGDEGEISATVLPSKYEFSVPFDKNGEIPSVTAQVMLESVNCRPTAPRKVNIRTRLRAVPRVLSELDISAALPADDSISTLGGELDSIQTKLLRSDRVTVSETMEINDSEEAKPVWCGANAAVTDIRVSDGGVQVRGDVYVKVMTANGAEAKMHMKKFPFEDFLDGDISKGASATAQAKVISTEVSREPQGDALVDVVLSVEAAVDTASRTPVVFDAFSESKDARVEYRAAPSARLVACRTGVYNVGGSVPKSTLAGFGTMLDTTGDVVVEEVEARGGKVTVNGKCALQSVYTTEDGEYSSAEYSLPFKLSFDCETPENLENLVSASLANVRTRVDGENLVCDMEIGMCLRAVERGERETVESIDLSNARTYEKSDFPLCLIYPQGDSLWTLAKKHHISPEKLAKINSLDVRREEYSSPRSLANTKVLMLQF